MDARNPLCVPVDDTSGAEGDPRPCQTIDADLWFSDLPSELELAKALCQESPPACPA
jgi:hypothetical protein